MSKANKASKVLRTALVRLEKTQERNGGRKVMAFKKPVTNDDEYGFCAIGSVTGGSSFSTTAAQTKALDLMKVSFREIADEECPERNGNYANSIPGLHDHILNEEQILRGTKLALIRAEAEEAEESLAQRGL